MNTPSDTVAILFADVAGSTQLYETLGDTSAQGAINRALAAMQAIVVHSGGRVIKTIGDEIMCELPTADAAAEAAVAIQCEFAEPSTDPDVPIRLRIGFHLGPVVIAEDQDIFGDAVNVAARMASIARAGQIITTENTVAAFSAAHRANTRQIDVTPVKGKSEDMAIYEVLWETTNVTELVPSLNGQAGPFNTKLSLQCGDRQVTLDTSTKSFLIGRDTGCNLVINSPNASRHHAKIEYRRGKFVLTDQSTNGTFVALGQPGGTREEIFLRREEFTLMNSGTLSLGVRPELAGEFALRFICS